MTFASGSVHALLFGLHADLAGELLRPLKPFCQDVQSIERAPEGEALKSIAESPAQVIFCDTDTNLVSELRSLRPDASIVVVSRHPEVEGWLDSIEAGADDYCAAPFESAQLGWILKTSRRSGQ